MVIKRKNGTVVRQSVTVNIHEKKKRRRKKRPQKKLAPPTKPSFPAMSGFTGGNYFGTSASQPFPQLIENRMFSMQQNLNNNVNNVLNTMKSENQLLHEKLLTLEHQQSREIENGNQLRAIELKQQVDQMARVFVKREQRLQDVEAGASDAGEFMRERVMPPDDKGKQPIRRDDDEPEEHSRVTEISDVGTGEGRVGRGYVNLVKSLMKRNAHTKQRFMNSRLGYFTPAEFASFLESIGDDTLKEIFGEPSKKGRQSYLSTTNLGDNIDALIGYMTDDQLARNDARPEHREEIADE